MSTKPTVSFTGTDGAFHSSVSPYHTSADDSKLCLLMRTPEPPARRLRQKLSERIPLLSRLPPAPFVIDFEVDCKEKKDVQENNSCKTVPKETTLFPDSPRGVGEEFATLFERFQKVNMGKTPFDESFGSVDRSMETAWRVWTMDEKAGHRPDGS